MLTSVNLNRWLFVLFYNEENVDKIQNQKEEADHEDWLPAIELTDSSSNLHPHSPASIPEGANHDQLPGPCLSGGRVNQEGIYAKRRQGLLQ